MIVGVGTDIVRIARMAQFRERFAERGLARLLAHDEIDACLASAQPDAFLAKRFAAKEALGKALGTGIRAPLLLPNISIVNDELGKPGFRLHHEAQDLLAARNWRAHLSLSDEQDAALAFVVVEGL